MKVDVEQGHARGALVEECLCGNGGVIDETVSTVHIPGSVVTGWATQREGFLRAVAN